MNLLKRIRHHMSEMSTAVLPLLLPRRYSRSRGGALAVVF
jgi:hypothetical protein